jgi:DNA replication and repair protein RecF
VRIRNIWLTDFRSYEAVHLSCPPGICAVIGDNGVGKTNLLEAIAYLATLSSFRSAPLDALISTGADSAVVRAEVEHEDRVHLIEAEINRDRPNRVMVNRQRLRRSKDLRDSLRVSVFSPDDLELLKGSPGVRRSYTDDLLVSLHQRNDTVRSNWEKALRQRNALLKQVGGRLDDTAGATLDVWDTKAAQAGEQLVALRVDLLERLGPHVQHAYEDIAGRGETVNLQYRSVWEGPLLSTLAQARRDDLRRSVTTMGPHRDEVVVELAGRPARTHCSQGEQRCLALAFRLAAHRLVAAEFGSPPVLLLDDVFSELDPERASALVAALPIGQAFVTTAAGLPDSVQPEETVQVLPGQLVQLGVQTPTPRAAVSE